MNNTDDVNKCLTLRVEFDNIVSRYMRRKKARGYIKRYLTNADRYDTIVSSEGDKYADLLRG